MFILLKKPVFLLNPAAPPEVGEEQENSSHLGQEDKDTWRWESVPWHKWKRLLVFANVLHANYLKLVISSFLRTRTFQYMNYSFDGLGFFLNRRTHIQLWPIQVVKLRCYLQVYQLTLVYSETLVVKKKRFHQVLKANDHIRTQHWLMSVKQIPASEKQMFEKTLLSLITNLEEKKRERCAGLQYTSSNGDILGNIFTNFSIKWDT